MTISKPSRANSASISGWVSRPAETVRLSQLGSRVWPYSVATQATTDTGCPARKDTSSRPSVVPAKIHSLHIPVSSGGDQLPGEDAGHGVADEHGAEHIRFIGAQLL